MSSNLISRSTVNAFTKSFSPSADPRYSYWVSRIFFVISEIFAGHILRQWCMECDVGWYSRQRRRRLLQFLRAFNSIDHSKFIQKYWWLRSPYTNYDYYAWYVTSSGVVNIDFAIYFVYDSFGRKDRRARTTTTTTMRGSCSRLVLSSAVAPTMSTVPTVRSRMIFHMHMMYFHQEQ